MNFHDFCPENTSKNMGPGEVPGHVFWALSLKVVLWIHFGIPLRSLWLPLGSLWYPFDSFGLPFDSLLSSLRLPFCVFFLTFSSLRSVSSSLYAFLLTFNSLGFVGSLSHPVATFVVRLRYFCGGSWLCFGSHGLRILFLVGVICHILYFWGFCCRHSSFSYLMSTSTPPDKKS